MPVERFGLCIISDKYFQDFPNIRHMSNKHEGRPYYLAVKAANGIVWVVPISSKVEKYQQKIRADEERHGESVFQYIAKVKGEDRAFLIGNVIPVTAEYIKKPFTVGGVPFMIENREDRKQIQSKVSRYLSLVRNKKLHPAVDILGIERKLINRIKNQEYMI